MWIVKVTKNRFERKESCTKHTFLTKSEANSFAERQINHTEVYKYETRKVWKKRLNLKKSIKNGKLREKKRKDERMKAFGLIIDNENIYCVK